VPRAHPTECNFLHSMELGIVGFDSGLDGVAKNACERLKAIRRKVRGKTGGRIRGVQPLFKRSEEFSDALVSPWCICKCPHKPHTFAASCKSLSDHLASAFFAIYLSSSLYCCANRAAENSMREPPETKD
jgi:hypothetical protein